jgi:hypothetical protein
VSEARTAAVGRRARAAGREARESTWLDRLARAGLVAKAASYALVAVLALGLALGAGGKATDREGALRTLAGETWGTVVLVALAVGFAGYALWRLALAVFGDGDDGAKDAAKRAGNLARAVVYGGLVYATARIALGSGGGGGSQTGEARQTTATVLDWPAGRWLVAAAGAALVGVGLYNGFRAVTQRFEERWREGSMSRGERRLGRWVGTVGLAARMVVFGLVGAFLVKAAVEYDPQEAIGLDGALQKLAGQPYGSWLLATLAAGLLAYAAYTLFEARYRDV